ncbi:DUF2336 domain-containing protein [Consotaella salsifontis]|uniref:Uncharacterized conserved protein, DUF2336 family n=1 Tax=Consotaella salsifontis TaxID=1365950 RepID=A0A1T4L882_9HYPH|nr:DUF2336 domain-containing protein [Consotaella salsifontis]SJZ50833.1 Uncharacterized conserved protein, DUF2336 family [Consotaella salsifontis]
MGVERFHDWWRRASCAERCYGVAALAAAWVEGLLSPDEIRDLETTFSLILNDPSPKVRKVLAEALAESRRAPATILRALAEDVDDIAVIVAERSPILDDIDLIDLLSNGNERLQCAIARRRFVSSRLAAAIIEVAGASACLELLNNEAAAVAGVSLQRLAARFGDVVAIRAALLDRRDLPASVRHLLIARTASALAETGLVRNVLGAKKADAIAVSACERATALLSESVPASEVPALVEHLRLSGALSPAFLIRAVVRGNVDLFAAALVALSGRSERRVRAIVVNGRPGAFAALLQDCGLPAETAPLFRATIDAWKRAVSSGAVADTVETPFAVAREVQKGFGESGGGSAGDLSELLRRLSREAADDAVSQRARRIAA